jgi:hypothetical protein
MSKFHVLFEFLFNNNNNNNNNNNSQERVLCYVFILATKERSRDITFWFLIENILKDIVHYLMTRKILGFQHGGSLLLFVLYSHEKNI